uniref:Uncharacterized protein n=1 Tax=Micrurus carvalhoi TaxID=3147026 RepID=A0A2H6NJL7_9SAUR
MLCFINSMTSSRESLLSWRRKGYRERTTSLDKQYLSKVLATTKMLKNTFNLHSTYFTYIKQTGGNFEPNWLFHYSQQVPDKCLKREQLHLFFLKEGKHLREIIFLFLSSSVDCKGRTEVH